MTDHTKDIFNESGPSHLKSINWAEEDDKRCVAASLVRAVTVMQRDCEAGRKGRKALAPPWYSSFNFELVGTLVDDATLPCGGLTFAAVFKYKYKFTLRQEPSPRYVIALRGTLPNSRELTMDLGVVISALHLSRRFDLTVQAVRDILGDVSEPNSQIWLVGHSLGSHFATLAAREMADRNGIFLTSFLFNPPFISFPVETLIRPKVRKHRIRVAHSVAKAVLAYATKGKGTLEADEARFVALSRWFPNMFVNPRDPICSEYKGYFEHRSVMEKIGMEWVEKLATKNSLKNLLKMSCEPIRQIPSARLIVNVGGASMGAYDAHALSQWWISGLHLDYKLYEYDKGTDA